MQALRIGSVGWQQAHTGYRLGLVFCFKVLLEVDEVLVQHPTDEGVNRFLLQDAPYVVDGDFALDAEGFGNEVFLIA